MAGFGSFFTSLSSSFKSVFNVQYYSEETVEVKGRNSAVADTSLRDKRIEASQNQASDQSRTIVDAAADQATNAIVAMERAIRVGDAHTRIAKQRQLGTAAVIYPKKNNPVELRLAEFEKRRQEARLVNRVTGMKRGRDDDQNHPAPLSNPDPNKNPPKKQKTETTTPSEKQRQRLRELATQKFLGMSSNFQKIALLNHHFNNPALKNLGFNNHEQVIKQMERWSREKDAEKLTRGGELPGTRLRPSALDENGKDLQTGEVRNALLMKYEENEARERWRRIARKIFRSNDVDSVTIGKEGTLTRKEAEELGFIRVEKGGGGKSSGGR